MTESNKSRIFYGTIILSLLFYIACIEEKLERARYTEGYIRADNIALRDRIFNTLSPPIGEPKDEIVKTANP